MERVARRSGVTTETSDALTMVGRAGPRWASPIGMLLSLGGLGISTYLTIAHYTGAPIVACPATGIINCAKVTTSPQSVILGVPVAVIGLAFFTTMLTLNVPVTWQHGTSPVIRLLRLVLSTFGVGFAVYLLSAELFVIHAICLWCTAAHVLAFLVFAVVVFTECLAVSVPPGSPGCRQSSRACE